MESHIFLRASILHTHIHTNKRRYTRDRSRIFAEAPQPLLPSINTFFRPCVTIEWDFSINFLARRRIRPRVSSHKPYLAYVLDLCIRINRIWYNINLNCSRSPPSKPPSPSEIEAQPCHVVLPMVSLPETHPLIRTLCNSSHLWRYFFALLPPLTLIRRQTFQGPGFRSLGQRSQHNEAPGSYR